MDIKKYFSFKGRISRMNYFYYQLFVGSPMAFIQITGVFFARNSILELLLLVLLVPLTVILFCKSIQRLHDISLSGILLLIPFIIYAIDIISPTYNFSIFQLIYHGFLLFKKGTEGYNKYGEAPLE